MQHVIGYISFTGMHFVDASDTLIIGECDVWKHVKYPLICKLDSAITEKTNISNISETKHVKMTNEMSKPMFSRSSNTMKIFLM